MIIPPVKVHFPDKEIENIKKNIEQVLKSGQLTMGRFGEAFEENFGKYVGIKYSIGVNSGTSALEIPLRIFGIGGGNVIVPANTFFATPAAVIHAGGKVKYADITKDTFSLDPASVLEKIDKNTAGVIVVHIGGIITQQINEIKEICEEHDLFLIEDCAHAHGSSLNGQKAGSFGDAGTFSFFPTKVMTSGEGGMITTNSDIIDKRSRIFRNQGMSWDVGNVNIEMGYNWRMSELHALVGLSQLKKLDNFIENRQKIAKLYDNLLKNFDGLRPLELPAGAKSNYYKYIAILDRDIDRVNLKKRLREEHEVALSSEVYDRPCHLQPVLKNGYKEGDFPVAEEVCKRHICLPIYPTMTEEEAKYVIKALSGVVE